MATLLSLLSSLLIVALIPLTVVFIIRWIQHKPVRMVLAAMLGCIIWLLAVTFLTSYFAG